MRETTVKIGELEVPAICCNTIIVGAGAAGMNCAVQLVKFWRAKGISDPQQRVLIVTGGRSRGASRQSGSDKQTYYKMGTSPRVADTAEEFANALTAFGCCHGDTAFVEGICSLRAFYHLVEVGVPFPHDPFGAFIGYKTDHDPYERATSAGPRTSKFMSECLDVQADRMGLRILDRHVVVRFITRGDGAQRRIVAMVCIDLSRASGEGFGLSVFVAANWVLAAGGPGELYATSVYPREQWGIHGPGFEAGLEACNLTESQYGLASTKFRWNVSGTYMQAIPRIYSTDAEGGDEREFLTEYFDEMPTMGTNIFLKGYQWPFDAQRITGHQSSLIDLAVHQETVVRGRRVWMDFLHNPINPRDGDEFHLNRLGDEALEYLQRTGAMQATPIERLRHMNPPAIEIYSQNGIDLTSAPLEIAVCAEHHNGGFAVNKWWESNIRGTFVIGELAGTHGVKRPGGSALNAGQVGGMRAAQYIANVYGAQSPKLDGPLATHLASALGGLVDRLRAMEAQAQTAPVTWREAMDEIRNRMTHYGAHLRRLPEAQEALDDAVAQYRRLIDGGMKIKARAELPAAVRTLQQCLTHVAMLKAIRGMFERKAGSRGSHCILDEDGVEMHPKLLDPKTNRPYCFRPENESLRDTILVATYSPESEHLFDLREVTPRPIPDRDIAFEPAWSEYREGEIYEI